MKATQKIIEAAKQKFKDLAHKNYDERSFKVGYFEGYFDIPENLLKLKYKLVIDRYLQLFCKKQGFEQSDYDFWVADEVGGVINISDFCFNFRDIKFDIDNNIEAGKILEWYDFTMKYKNRKINYKTWLKINK